MPASAPAPDVLVIGAGVIGLATAWELLRRGLRVQVFECGRVGPGGASWAGGGILAPLEPALLDDIQSEFLRDSLAGYAAWCAELQAASGIDPEYLVSGLRLIEPLARESWTSWARGLGLDVHADAAGLLLPGIAQVRSPRLLRALAAAVRARGGVIHEEQAVQALIGGSRVRGVRTAGGELAAPVVILCAGAWSEQLVPTAGIEPVKGEMLLFEGRPGELPHILMHEGMYLIPRRDGRIVAGSTLQACGFDAQPSAQGRETIFAAVRGLWPELARRGVIGHWAGLRPAPRTGGPKIGWVADREGLLINAGQHRLGITLAPGSARRATQLLLSARPGSGGDVRQATIAGWDSS